MRVDDTYWFILRKTNEAAHMNAKIDHRGSCTESVINNFSEHLATQIQKLNAGHGLALINLPEA